MSSIISPVIELYHTESRMRKFVHVVGIARGQIPNLLIHWPLSGVYFLDLKDETLRQFHYKYNRRRALKWEPFRPMLCRQLHKYYKQMEWYGIQFEQAQFPDEILGLDED